MVTLKDDKTGDEDTVYAGPEVKRFAELKVGDKVKIRYYESLVLQVRKPGESATTKPDDTALTRGTGPLPGATLARQQVATVTVVAIDDKVPSVTVKTSDGRTVTRKVENRKNLQGVAVGDRVDLTYTQAAVLEVEPIK